MNGNATANSGQTAETVSNAAGAAPSNEPQPLVITNLQQLSDAVIPACQVVAGEKPTRMFSAKGGFKSFGGLEGLSNEVCAVMIGQLQMRIALNGGTNVGTLLGRDKNPGIISKFGIQIQAEADQERKINTYAAVIEDLKLSRNDGESATDFVARIQTAARAALQQ